MKMSSSMYEVFNWNSSPDPPLTPAKHKRASLSLPPTTDIFAIDDKSDSDIRRPMIQRAASGESRTRKKKVQKERKRDVCNRGDLFCCPNMSCRHVLVYFSVSVSLYFSFCLPFSLYLCLSLSLSFISTRAGLLLSRKHVTFV